MLNVIKGIIDVSKTERRNRQQRERLTVQQYVSDFSRRIRHRCKKRDIRSPRVLRLKIFAWCICDSRNSVDSFYTTYKHLRSVLLCVYRTYCVYVYDFWDDSQFGARSFLSLDVDLFTRERLWAVRFATFSIHWRNNTIRTCAGLTEVHPSLRVTDHIRH